MYKIEVGSLDDYKNLAHHCIESGKLDYRALEGCHIDKLTCDDKTIALVGYKELEFDEYPGKPFLIVSAVFDKAAKKHVRVLKEVGHPYLDSIQKYPLVALAQEENPIYGKFLESFGFVFTKTVEKDEETGIMYKVYIRC
jgi:hypothetical protein